MEKFTYVLYTDPSMENSPYGSYNKIYDALSAAIKLAEEGFPADDLRLMKLHADGSERAWDDYLVFDEQCRVDSRDWDAVWEAIEATLFTELDTWYLGKGDAQE